MANIRDVIPFPARRATRSSDYRAMRNATHQVSALNARPVTMSQSGDVRAM